MLYSIQRMRPRYSFTRGRDTNLVDNPEMSALSVLPFIQRATYDAPVLMAYIISTSTIESVLPHSVSKADQVAQKNQNSPLEPGTDMMQVKDKRGGDEQVVRNSSSKGGAKHPLGRVLFSIRICESYPRARLTVYR